MIRSHVLAGLALALLAPLPAQNCSRSSTGLVPLTDLGTTKYQGFEGGLYRGGVNAPPAAHLAAGVAIATGLQPRDATGKPDPNGKVVLLSIGMSNTTQEYSAFKQISDPDPNRKASVVVVDGAQGGQDATKVSDPNAPFWTVVDQRLQRAGVTPQQVAVVWLKEAVARPTKAFPADAQELQGLLEKIVRILKQRYANQAITYLSSRIYAGYATTTLNPEPYAYQSGFAVRWLIDQQVGGDPALNFDPNKGAVQAAWLAWGPYLWADGLKGRKIDSLIWECSDFQADGTHPSTSGRQKVAQLLDAHFRTDPTTKPWYVGPGGNKRAAVVNYGSGCAGSRGPLLARTNSLPFVGNQAFRYGVVNAIANTQAVAFLSGGRAQIGFDGCTVLWDPARFLLALTTTTNGSGTAILDLPVPNDPAAIGQLLDTQWFARDAASTVLRSLGGGALSQGVELRFGTQ